MNNTSREKLKFLAIPLILILLFVAGFLIFGGGKKDDTDGNDGVNTVEIVTAPPSVSPAETGNNDNSTPTEKPTLAVVTGKEQEPTGDVTELPTMGIATVTEEPSVTGTATVTDTPSPDQNVTVTEKPVQIPTAVETPEATETPVPEKQYYFRSKKLLESHYEKHGIDMGFASKEEYEAAASAVVNNPDALHKTEKEDGDDIYYLEDTNEFVVVSTDGYLRTYFLPDAGKKYYDKQ